MDNNYIRLKRDMNSKGRFPGNGIHQGDWEYTGQDSKRASISFLYFNNFGGKKKVTNSKKFTNSKKGFQLAKWF